MANTNKSTFNQFQSLVTILMPLIVAGGGWYGHLLQQDVVDAQRIANEAKEKIAQIETSIKNVEAMETFFKMMGGENDAEAKMAAYALYMLNKDDPEMAVSMIMAPGKDYLISVLIDLGSREPRIFEEVQKILATQDDSREGSSMQQAAQQIIWDIGASGNFADASTVTTSEDSKVSDDPGAWCYLGNFDTGEGKRIDELGVGELPTKGSSYTLNRGVNLRSDYPRKENGYKPAGVIGVAREGDEISITELDVDSKNRVWAQVSVASQ